MSSTTFDRGDHFRFGLVFIKKSNQTDFFFETKNQNRVKPTGFGSVFLGQKPVQTGLARFFRFWLSFLGFGSVFSSFGSVFSVLAWFFPVLARFFRFGSVFFWFFVGFGSVFFGFLLIKPKPNRPVFSKM
jgi:hypothetical protein